MEEHKDWFASSSTLEGKEIITRGRRELEKQMSSKRYPHRVEIMWEYKANNAGMPANSDEDKLMNEVAFLLGETCEKDLNGLLCALYTGADRFIMVFHIHDMNHFSQQLQKCLSKYPRLPIHIGHIDDPEWEDYRNMLAQNMLIL